MLFDLEMSKGELRVKSSISTRQLAKHWEKENVFIDVFVKVCKILDCTVDEIMDIIDTK